MKLLPKPRGKVTRKPILGTELEQRNRFHYNETSSERGGGKKLAYNEFSKRLIQENPGIIKAIDFLSNNRSEKRFVDPKGKYEILKVTDLISNENTSNPRRGGLTIDSYFIKLKSGKVEYKFFLKKQNADSVEELILLKSLEKYALKSGFKIIQPHLAFDDYNALNKYILYDFTNKLTVDDAFKLKLLKDDEYMHIRTKLEDFETVLNEKHFVPAWNLKSQNCFVDLSTTPYKLYLFDPKSFIGYNKDTLRLKKLQKKLINKK